MIKHQPDIKTKKLERHCSICDKGIAVTLYPDKTYKGGNYFGKIPIGKKKKAEYWECNRCFNK